MSTHNKSIILAESSRLIGQIGNNIVLDLYARIREIEALTRTLAATAENLLKSETEFKRVIPGLIDFQGDLSIAGGGIWPQPGMFEPGRDRRSFFWGRNATGTLEYYDDYNQPGRGYHQEAWYVVGRHTNRDRCVWSPSYMDPYSFQPMVTCTAPMLAEGKFAGVVTIDLKLEGLQNFVETWRNKTGGYIFVLDHLNRFITFPDLAQVRFAQTERGKLVEKFYLAADFAARQPLFASLATAVEQMNQTTLERAKAGVYDQNAVQLLSQSSDQISQAEAELIVAILTDPLNSATSLGEKNSTTYLHKSFEIDNDALLHEAATVFLFHVPHTYWKVMIVKPFSEAALATYTIIQSEKMSSLGQLVAGVAHEVNNPVNFISGNLTYAHTYIQDLLQLVQLYQEHYPDPPVSIQEHLDASDFDFIVADLPKILDSMKVGTDRIRQIVLSLKNFSRMDEAEFKRVDVHEGLESTLLLLDSRLKATAGDRPSIQIIREYGDLPKVECYPGPLNQVFMNLLVNAIDALEESFELRPDPKIVDSNTLDTLSSRFNPPTITIRTGQPQPNRLQISIADNGTGIPETLQQKMFDPFFTTKAVGKGTGLGLAICYQIVTEKHRGQIRCISSPGLGTEFIVEIPLRQQGV